MSREQTEPKCRLIRCFGNKEGHCFVLTDNNFGGKPCPCYKTTAIESKPKKQK